MRDEHWDWLTFYARVRATITGARQSIYAFKIGDEWHYWSTAAGAGYGSDPDAPAQELREIEQYRRERFPA